MSSSKKSQSSSSAAAKTAKAAAQAKEILKSAYKVLQKVDKADVFTKLKKRDFPMFELEEIQPFGPELGVGGFSRVQEITQVKLKKKVIEGINEESEEEETKDDDKEKNNNINDDKSKEDSIDDDMAMIAQIMGKKIGSNGGGCGDGALLDDEHYDVGTARQTIAQKCIRKGSGSRYCVKKLKAELDPVERARGALDLAVEIRYLSVLWHPNIVKMRGISSTPEVSQDTFLLLDRLYGTLESRFDEWEQIHAMNKSSGSGGCCGGGGGDGDPSDPAVRDFLKSRLLVAYDLTCAFQYLHDAKLVYRDIKPENIGFDIRGDVKVFDFGLCRSMDKADKNKNGHGYKLTAKTGSIPYMAPEVARGEPYDEKADVFSFAVLLWEILSVDWAFNGFSIPDYFQRVVKENQRMPIRGGASWPAMIKHIVKEGWDKDPEKRPDMKQMGSLIRAELNELSEESAVLNRTMHMLNRSQHSFRGLRASWKLDGSSSLKRSITRRCTTSSGGQNAGGGE